MRKLLSPSLLLFLAACGSTDVPYDEPGETPTRPQGPAQPEDAATDPDTTEGPSEKPSGHAESEAKRQRLAEKLLSGGVGWHHERKVFVVVTTFSQEGTGTGVIATVASEKDAYETQDTLCEPGAGCDGDSAKLLAAATKWLGKQKLDGAFALELTELKPVAGFPTAEIGSIGGKLVWKKDHFDVVRGFKPTSLPKMEFAKEFKPTVAQATASPDGKLALALFNMDPGANYAKGSNVHVDIKVFPVP